MYILAIDTTAKTATASINEVRDNEVFPLCSCNLNGTLTHSESTLPMIDFCLKSANIPLSQVEVLAVSAGPGSFTGVRIGISTVKGLAFGMENVKCVPVSALEALAANVDDETKGTVICPCMDARRNQVYNALFMTDGKGNIKRLCADRALSVDELYTELTQKYPKKKILLVGDGTAVALKHFVSQTDFANMKITKARCDRLYQSSVSVARCAVRHIEQCVPHENLSPVYLRLSQAERERAERMGNQ